MSQKSQATDNIKCGKIEMVDIADLRPNPKNTNIHPDRQIALLAKIIRAQGWRSPITVSKRSGLIVTGHARLEAAKLLGLARVPVDRQDFASESEEEAHLLADNRITELAERDNAATKDLLEQLDTGLIDMDLTGYDAMEIEKMMTQVHQKEDEDEPSGVKSSTVITCPHCGKGFKK